MEHKMGEDTCINIIFDNRYSDDYERLLAEFKTQGIEQFRFWDAVVIATKPSYECINASHKKIVRWAKEKELSECIIMEQDCTFPSKYGWQHFLNNKPQEFDIYSAATYVEDTNNKNILCGFQLYIVNNSFYDAFLSVDDKLHIDTEVANLKGDFHVCRPFAALQRPGWSSNNMAQVNYNSLLKPEDIYQ